jgi:hypothetical protein
VWVAGRPEHFRQRAIIPALADPVAKEHDRMAWVIIENLLEDDRLVPTARYDVDADLSTRRCFVWELRNIDELHESRALFHAPVPFEIGVPLRHRGVPADGRNIQHACPIFEVLADLLRILAL